jgi:hypothetical protein
MNIQKTREARALEQISNLEDPRFLAKIAGAIAQQLEKILTQGPIDKPDRPQNE